MFVFLNMYAINQPEVMIGNAAERFSADGTLTDDKSKELIRKLLSNLVEWAARVRPPSGA
jgi:chromate reductase